MKILLFGATGRTGRIILQKALKDGHEVTAIVRDPSKINGTKANIVQGSPYDKKTVQKAMAGCDAVINTLNISRTSDSPWAKLRSPKDLISRTAQNAIDAMKENNTKRIIVMSTIGAGESKKKLPFIVKLVVGCSNLRHAFKDHTRQEEILANSDRNWTVIRFPMLTEEEGENEILVNMNDGTKINRNINRETVARFILSILGDEKYYKKVIAISNK